MATGVHHDWPLRLLLLVGPISVSGRCGWRPDAGDHVKTNSRLSRRRLVARVPAMAATLSPIHNRVQRPARECRGHI